jgi:hypothetical protein
VRYIDFKAAGARPEIDQLQRVATSLREGRARDAIFGFEDGSGPPADWLAELAALNQGLAPLGLEIKYGTVGTF